MTHHLLQLIRTVTSDEGTVGHLIDVEDGVEICRTMELPWRDNRPNVSRIPPGRYRARYLPRSASGRYRDVYHVTGVPGRSGILIHAGNWAGDREAGLRSHTWGCVLPATRHGRLAGQLAGLASRGALTRLHAAVERQDFLLEVIDHA